MTKTAIDLPKLKEDLFIEKDLRGFNMRFFSTWGLFSPEKIDEGSELLIEKVKVLENDLILDLGSGYGAIGLTLAKSAPGGFVHLVDKDFVATEYTRKNAKLNDVRNTKAYLSNGFSNVSENQQFDLIVSNLPSKINKELFLILFYGAKEYLKPNGRFVVVTISGLKEFIKRNFQEIFGNYEKIAHSNTYTVFSATKE